MPLRERTETIHAQQGQLLLSRDDRLAQLDRSAVPEKIKLLLREIELTSGSDGWSRSSQEVLADRCKVVTRTLQRRVDDAESWGLVRKEKDPDGAGLRYAVAWDRVRTFKRHDKLSYPHDSLSYPYDNTTRLPIGSGPLSSPESEKEKKRSSSSPSEAVATLSPLDGDDWSAAVGLLSRLGVRTARKTIRDSQECGWSAEQAIEFLAAVDAETCNGETKYKPGALNWQLTKAEPGSTINMPVRDEWLRERGRGEAQREFLSEIAAERAARASAAEARRDRVARQREQERRFGAHLDQFIADGRIEALIDGTNIKPQFAMRCFLLDRFEELTARGSEQSSTPAGAQDERPPAGG